MKKIILVFIILFILFFNIKGKANTIKNIDLNVSENEIFLVFIKIQNTTSFLLIEPSGSDIFIFKNEINQDFQKNYSIFNVNPNVHILKEKFIKKIKNSYVYINKDRFIIRINNYTMCMYNDKYKNISGCNFVYLESLSKNFIPPKNVNIIFYDESVPEHFLTNTFESWVDSHIVDKESILILKFEDESYELIIIPTNQ